ncbi:MAG: UvrD-helicase domain-containing protein [Nitrospirae bacterium]|nr:UvrD-helicase domain-containing protein [Nitrospirota bacterium]
MSKEGLMQDLNLQQKEALQHISGPLLVLAGAGSGKTKVITHKFAYLVKTHKTPVESVLAVTFTNKAAAEMRSRIGNLLPGDIKHSWIGTLHSQCGRILRAEIKHLGYSPDFSIYDEDDRCNLIRHILKDFKIYEALYKGVSSRINLLKTSLIDPDTFLTSGDGFGFDEKLAKVYVRYQDELQRSNALDFDDLIMLTVKLFKEHPKVLRKYQDLFAYLLVDEFQDLNASQYSLMKLIAKQHKNICAVGDDDQSIYRFRGADVQHILNFEKDFPGAKVVRLERNYRSTQNILDVSHAVISMNPNRKGKKLWTEKGRGEKVNVCWLNNEEEEARHIAKIVKELYLKGAYSYGEIGILYRVNLQSRAIEDALRDAGLPYRVVAGISFYQRKEIKDVIAYARLTINHGDNVSLRRVINTPHRGIGAATLTKIESEAKKKSVCLFDVLKSAAKSSGIVTSTKEKLGGFIHLIEQMSAKDTANAAHFLRDIVKQTGYTEALDDDRKQNVEELIASAEGRDIRDFLDKASLQTNAEEGASSDHVSLMTLHNAKGLEFPVVFVTGIEEGVLPYFKAIGKEDEIAEERRLFYVGMTRAKEMLLLSGSKKRRLYSRIQEQEPSRFLKDLPREHCLWTEKVTEFHTMRSEGKRADIVAKIKPMFASGCRVKHPVWGIGVIRDCYGDGEDQKVMVNFPAIGLKRLSLKLANLTKI